MIRNWVSLPMLCILKNFIQELIKQGEYLVV